MKTNDLFLIPSHTQSAISVDPGRGNQFVVTLCVRAWILVVRANPLSAHTQALFFHTQ